MEAVAATAAVMKANAVVAAKIEVRKDIGEFLLVSSETLSEDTAQVPLASRSLPMIASYSHPARKKALAPRQGPF